jgi:hypothetical protein
MKIKRLHIEKFKIGEEEIHLQFTLNRATKRWDSKPIKGFTGCTAMSSAAGESLEDAVEKAKKVHTETRGFWPKRK